MTYSGDIPTAFEIARDALLGKIIPVIMLIINNPEQYSDLSTSYLDDQTISSNLNTDEIRAILLSLRPKDLRTLSLEVGRNVSGIGSGISARANDLADTEIEEFRQGAPSEASRSTVPIDVETIPEGLIIEPTRAVTEITNAVTGAPSSPEIEQQYSLTAHYLDDNGEGAEAEIRLSPSNFRNIFSDQVIIDLLQNRVRVSIENKIDTLGDSLKTKMSEILTSDQDSLINNRLERFTNSDIVFEILTFLEQMKRETGSDPGEYERNITSIIDYLNIGIETTVSRRLSTAKFKNVSVEKPFSVVKIFGEVFGVKQVFEDLPANSFYFKLRVFKERVKTNAKFSNDSARINLESSSRLIFNETDVLDPLNLVIHDKVASKINEIRPGSVAERTTHLFNNALQEIYDLLSNPTDGNGRYKPHLRILFRVLDINLGNVSLGDPNFEPLSDQEIENVQSILGDSYEAWRDSVYDSMIKDYTNITDNIFTELRIKLNSRPATEAQVSTAIRTCYAKFITDAQCGLLPEANRNFLEKMNSTEEANKESLRKLLERHYYYVLEESFIKVFSNTGSDSIAMSREVFRCRKYYNV